MNRSQRNRNPGNLKYAGQKGAIGQDDKGLAIFGTHIDGWRALIRQIKLDMTRRLTVEQFITKYAPPSENDTKNYLKFICTGLKCRPDAQLSEYHPAAVAGLIAWFEGYFNEVIYETTQK